MAAIAIDGAIIRRTGTATGGFHTDIAVRPALAGAEAASLRDSIGENEAGQASRGGWRHVEPLRTPRRRA